VPPSPPSYNNNLFKPHASLNPHTSSSPFTDTRLKHRLANYISAGFHLYTNDTRARKIFGQPTPIKTCNIMGPQYPLQLSTQHLTHSTANEALQGPIQDHRDRIATMERDVLPPGCGSDDVNLLIPLCVWSTCLGVAAELKWWLLRSLLPLTRLHPYFLVV
jgi:hypothetical protein